jgi:hypothetical protein
MIFLILSRPLAGSKQNGTTSFRVTQLARCASMHLLLLLHAIASARLRCGNNCKITPVLVSDAPAAVMFFRVQQEESGEDVSHSGGKGSWKKGKGGKQRSTKGQRFAGLKRGQKGSAAKAKGGMKGKGAKAVKKR